MCNYVATNQNKEQFFLMKALLRTIVIKTLLNNGLHKLTEKYTPQQRPEL